MQSVYAEVIGFFNRNFLFPIVFLSSTSFLLIFFFSYNFIFELLYEILLKIERLIKVFGNSVIYESALNLRLYEITST